MAEPTAQLTDVVIVGGGVGGLAAANVLIEEKVSFVLIEGRHRVGGRVFPVSVSTDQFSDISPNLDLGASYWHCCLGDPEKTQNRSRPRTRSVAGLASIHRPRVAIVAGESKWEDTMHAKWFGEGPISSISVLKVHLFLGRVYEKATKLLKSPNFVQCGLFVSSKTNLGQCKSTGQFLNIGTQDGVEGDDGGASAATLVTDAAETEEKLCMNLRLKDLGCIISFAESCVIAELNVETHALSPDLMTEAKKRRLKRDIEWSDEHILRYSRPYLSYDSPLKSAASRRARGSIKSYEASFTEQIDSGKIHCYNFFPYSSASASRPSPSTDEEKVPKPKLANATKEKRLSIEINSTARSSRRMKTRSQRENCIYVAPPSTLSRNLSPSNHDLQSDRIKVLRKALTDQEVKMYLKCLRSRICYVSNEIETSACTLPVPIDADKVVDPWLERYGDFSQEFDRSCHEKYSKMVSMYDFPNVKPCNRLWNSPGDRIMVDSWQWLLDCLMKPLLSAVETFISRSSYSSERTNTNFQSSRCSPFVLPPSSPDSLAQSTHTQKSDGGNLTPSYSDECYLDELSSATKLPQLSPKRIRLIPTSIRRRSRRKLKQRPEKNFQESITGGNRLLLGHTVKRIEVRETAITSSGEGVNESIKPQNEEIGRSLTEQSRQFPVLVEFEPTSLPVVDKDASTTLGTLTSTENKSSVACARSQIRCKYVICTVPIGVLKASREQPASIEFNPPFSLSRQIALGNFGMGAHQKILLQFSDIFWPANTPQLNTPDSRCQFLNLSCYGKHGWLLAHVFPPFSENWNLITQEPNVAKVSDEDVVDKSAEQSPVWRNSIHGSRNSISDSTVTGGHRHQRNRERKTSEAEIVKAVCGILQEMFGLASCPFPINTIITDWASDMFSLGSYSFFATGFREADFYTLRAPHPLQQPRVLFAGEAYSACYHQCVDGAFDTGTRAAESIVKEGLKRNVTNGGIELIPQNLIGYYLTDSSDVSEDDEELQCCLDVQGDENQICANRGSWLLETGPVKGLIFRRELNDRKLEQNSGMSVPFNEKNVTYEIVNSADLNDISIQDLVKIFKALPTEVQNHYFKRWIINKGKRTSKE